MDQGGGAIGAGGGGERVEQGQTGDSLSCQLLGKAGARRSSGPGSDPGAAPGKFRRQGRSGRDGQGAVPGSGQPGRGPRADGPAVIASGLGHDGQSGNAITVAVSL